jgi:hypothetical protein
VRSGPAGRGRLKAAAPPATLRDQNKNRDNEQNERGNKMTATTETKKEIDARLGNELRQFSGSENRFKHFTGRLVYTDGVRHLANAAGAHWLIDAIASHQGDRQLKSDPRLREIQFWSLTVNDDRSAVLTCQADSGERPAVQQQIEFTDFPLKALRLFCAIGHCDGRAQFVLMLPSEY